MPWLDWLDKKKHLEIAGDTPYHLLEHVKSKSVGDDPQNMLIHGDNLHVLKALRTYYAGGVKCIFIDPPYNTKSAFKEYDDNLEHSQWLSMMYPRMVLLHELLAEDGSIWITLDDNEAHYFKVMCDGIFNRKNFIADVIWQKMYTVKNSAKHLSEMHDHVLVYAKCKDKWKRNLLPRSAELDETYTNQDGDPRGPWTTNALQARNYYSEGSYTVISPTGQKFNPPTGTYWRISEANFKALNSTGQIWWGKNGKAAPRVKKYLSEAKQGVVPATIWLHKDAGTNGSAKAHVRDIFADEGLIFDTPKPEELIKRVLEIATNPGDLVLDSFLGSGTTAAVAHKMGRKWIGVEQGDHAISHCLPRMKKVIQGEAGGVSAELDWKGGGGFRFYKLGAPIFDEHGDIHPEIRFEHLANHVWFSETGLPKRSMEMTSPYLGEHDGTHYYLLFNGILGDKRPKGGNVLTLEVLKHLPSHEGRKVIYGEANMLTEHEAKKRNIVFKSTPYDIRAS